MATVYYANEQTWNVEDVECDKTGWPNRDSIGRVMYVNTHFDTPVAAWEKLISEASAGVELGVRERRRLTSALDRVTKEVAGYADAVMRAKEGLEQARKVKP